jgi:deazaflavin-dependent oxidoreductase (nitroreductase family)
MDFLAPSPTERLFNRAFGVLVGLGLGMRHSRLLEVRGRTTGRVYTTPVNVLELKGRRYLVAGRGRTQWVRNAEASGEVALRKGRARERYRLRAVTGDEKAQVLSAYVHQFKLTVQRYFSPIPAGAPPSAFTAVLDRYPVFELLP